MTKDNEKINLELEKILESNIALSEQKNVREIILNIPYKVYMEQFGYSFTEIQYFVRDLCIKYKLEVSVTDITRYNYEDIKYRGKRLNLDENSTAVKIVFTKDPYYIGKDKE